MRIVTTEVNSVNGKVMLSDLEELDFFFFLSDPLGHEAHSLPAAQETQRL